MLHIAALMLFALVPINIVFIVKCYAWVLRLQLWNLMVSESLSFLKPLHPIYLLNLGDLGAILAVLG